MLGIHGFLGATSVIVELTYSQAIPWSSENDSTAFHVQGPVERQWQSPFIKINKPMFMKIVSCFESYFHKFRLLSMYIMHCIFVCMSSFLSIFVAYKCFY